MYIKIFLLIIVVIFVLVFFNIRKKNHIEILIRQSARWAMAAEQDKNPIIALLHANYAAAYLWALLDISTTSKIESISNIDIMKFKNHIVEIQDKATKNLIDLCPNIKPSNMYLATIAGEA